MLLIQGCHYCGNNGKLLRCSGCKVTSYCNQQHQVSDRLEHAKKWNAVKQARNKFEKEEQALREYPGGGFWQAYPLENCVGHFWGILPTRDYMRARFGLSDALLGIQTFGAVNAATEHIRDMLRLCRSDNMGVRDIYPHCLLRLGRDQECYDFVKWYATTGQGSYDWGNMSLPYLDIVDADVFESPKYVCRKYPDLSHLVCTTLLKIKLWKDLEALGSATFLEKRLPRELIDRIKYFIPRSDILRKNGIMMTSGQRLELISRLEIQIDVLFEAVEEANEHFWPALIYPGKDLEARPETYSDGDVTQMQVVLMSCYKSWVETDGAIQVIEAKLDECY